MASPNLAAYNAVIDVCARCGDADKAAAVFKSMMSAGVMPDLLTYTLLIKGYVVQGDLEQAIQLFTLMRKRSLQPDVALQHLARRPCPEADVDVGGSRDARHGRSVGDSEREHPRHPRQAQRPQPRP